MLAEVKKAAGFRQLACQAAKDAARFLHAPIGAVQSGAGEKAEDVPPVIERMKIYAREEAIAASAAAGKGVEIKRKKRRPQWCGRQDQTLDAAADPDQFGELRAVGRKPDEVKSRRSHEYGQNCYRRRTPIFGPGVEEDPGQQQRENELSDHDRAFAQTAGWEWRRPCRLASRTGCHRLPGSVPDWEQL
jgi:hypothetical protein